MSAKPSAAGWGQFGSDPAQTTPFADAALVLRGHGLAPVPLGGDDGKVPLVRYRTWEKLPGRHFLESEVNKHHTANVGILTGLSGITVVDVAPRQGWVPAPCWNRTRRRRRPLPLLRAPTTSFGITTWTSSSRGPGAWA